MTRSKLACCCLAGAAFLLAPAAVRAQVARIELHTFQSTTLTDQEFLAGTKEGKPVVLAGELRLPPGSGRFPVVVLVHGSGGVSGYVDGWVSKLNALGVATFVFDSFTPRGILDTRDDQSQLGRLAMIVDAYRALALLAKHPRVDPARIALMGFSRGGQATLYASLRRFQRMHAPPDAAFALFVPFYPDCSTRYLEDEDVVDRPIRLFHGTDDDWAPVAPCRAYVERLVKARKDVRLTEYPGAQHVFDWAALKTPVKLAKAQTVRHCRMEEISGGRLVNSETKQVFTYADPCVERGTTMAYNAEAATEAATEAELQSAVFRAKPAVVMIAVRIGATATVRCSTGPPVVVRPGTIGELGSGSIIHPDGWIVTNGHVVQPYQEGAAGPFGVELLERAVASACAPELDGLSPPARTERIRALAAQPENRGGLVVERALEVHLSNGKAYPAAVKFYSPPAYVVVGTRTDASGNAHEEHGRDVAIVKVEDKELPVVRNGLGITIVSTPKGVLSDAEARAQNVGGEVLAEVF